MSLESIHSALKPKDEFLEIAKTICQQEIGVHFTTPEYGISTVENWRPLRLVDVPVSLRWVNLIIGNDNRMQVERARFEANDMEITVERVFVPNESETHEYTYDDWLALNILESFRRYMDLHDHKLCSWQLAQANEACAQRAD